MVKEGIKIFLRAKPSKKLKGHTELDDDGIVTFNIPKEDSEGYVNNKKDLYKFKFEEVFPEKTQQDEIFEKVCKNAAESARSGYNATIFAYGQTGSGKTFTITGGAEKYKDRGMIPRSISYIFQSFEQNPNCQYTMHISYLEIYNESGYDLLDPAKEVTRLEDLPRVRLQEDAEGNFHTRNLTIHQANSEEDALNLLFMGDTNRMTAETPMNMASTRSHCIFTIYISCKSEDSPTIRRGKLHLVDLAGSERVSKTGVSGTILSEAKYINISLHFLELVITALGERSRTHIPYRNSMMTSMLRDSLGGNCLTTMVATVSLEKKNIDESISTCRFAQRVALIKNDAVLNEEVDPKLVVTRLKKEIQNLRDDIALAGREVSTDPLSDEELLMCRERVNKYIECTDPEERLDIDADVRKIHFCYQYFKHLLKQAANSRPASNRTVTSATSQILPEQVDKELNKLKELLAQRDTEINILVNLLKKEKAKIKGGGGGGGVEKPISPPPVKPHHQTQRNVKTLSKGRQEAFDIFRRDYKNNSAIEQNKSELKTKMKEAKQIGGLVNKSREKINSLKSSIEQRRIAMAVQGLVHSDVAEFDPKEEELKKLIESEKESYKQRFARLRELKTGIEHLQHLLEQQRVRLQRDFELWYVEQAAGTQQGRTAWKTPSPKHLASLTDEVRSSGNPTPNTDLPSPPMSKESSYLSNHNSVLSNNSNTKNPVPSIRSNDQKSWSVSQSTVKNGALTGDAGVDNDIMSFMRAREAILRRSQK
ncbi:kinesin-like protein KIF6 [Bolinopsis microptera]|uniref:kinesin-like protein KIF6 n=1 Tax=Bolinopsis microptera TaxID=2820187 RepID=UPI003078BFA7